MSINEISLKWNGFHANILNKVKSLFQEELTSDVTLVAQGLNFKAHKIVLSANSGVFKSIFEQNPHKDPIIVLHDLNTEALKKLLTFMYCGEVNVTEEFLPILLKAADTLRICGLSSTIDFEELESSPTPKKRKQDSEFTDLQLKPKDLSTSFSSNLGSVSNDVIPKVEPLEPVCCDVTCETSSEKLTSNVEKQSASLDNISISTESSDGKEDKGLHKWISEILESQSLNDDRVVHTNSDAKDNNESDKSDTKQDASSDETLEKEKSAAIYASPSFPCPFCPRVYNSWGYRRRHVKSRHVTNKLSCKWCLSTHSSQASWYAHATKAHGMSAEEARNSLVVMVEAHAVLTPIVAEPSVAQLLGQVDIPLISEDDI